MKVENKSPEPLSNSGVSSLRTRVMSLTPASRDLTLSAPFVADNTNYSCASFSRNENTGRKSEKVKKILCRGIVSSPKEVTPQHGHLPISTAPSKGRVHLTTMLHSRAGF
jgi:hypothetical protein